ncbi:DUF1996 domain-containing protein [Cellulomonas sp. URHD0024]|uniref:DUF1996 domain-containing protein n=1 Tax=Cellulomonas sp. URHD0024 TaxID=1302620 RepID=UPI0004015F30|nr:DUF1996 domain-containing protein [Cellulomonas sp. URHD0024]
MSKHKISRSSGRARAWVAVALASALIGAGAVGIASGASAAPINLSQGRIATASSSENAGLNASFAVDGDNNTRWASQFSDNQFIQVDLGASATLSSVQLRWEAAYGKSFQVLTSADGAAWTTAATITNGTGGNQTINVSGTARFVKLNLQTRATGYGFSLWEFQVFGTGGSTTPPYSPKPLPPAPPGADTTVTHHEFQANCTPNKTLPDDPIVFPGQPGASHSHTFMGNSTTNAATTAASLLAASASTSCTVPQDKSAYWFPTLLKNGTQVVSPSAQTIYYKAGILDYKKVQPFPAGLRFVVGSMLATQSEFQNAPGHVEGFECGNLSFQWDIPAYCAPGSELNVRYQAPSCWNGVDLDSANHKSHMAYPVNGACPAGYPIPVPMLEFKLSWPVSGDMSGVAFSSGRGYSFHYDFFNAWDPAVLSALTQHCIDGGLQCTPKGFDIYKTWAGGVLDANNNLIP